MSPNRGRPAGASDTLGVQADIDFLAASVASYPNSLGDALAELEAIILASPEFLSKSGATTSGFVEGLYESVLGRSATGDAGATQFVGSPSEEFYDRGTR